MCEAELAFFTPLAVCACQRRIRSLSEWRANCNSMLKSHREVVREEKEGHGMWNIHETLLKRCALPMTRLIIFRKCKELGEKIHVRCISD